MVGNVVIPMLFVTKCSVAFWIGAATFFGAWWTRRAARANRGYALTATIMTLLLCSAVCAVTAMFKPKPAFTPTPSTGLADRFNAANEARRRHTK